MSTTVAHKLTRKKLQRLEEFAKQEREIRVTGWSDKFAGPIVTFYTPTGAPRFIVTRDGGLNAAS